MNKRNLGASSAFCCRLVAGHSGRATGVAGLEHAGSHTAACACGPGRCVPHPVSNVSPVFVCPREAATPITAGTTAQNP